MNFHEPHRPKCSVPGCSVLTEESGLCHDHRTRWIVAGRPERDAWCVEQGKADAQDRLAMKRIVVPAKPVMRKPLKSATRSPRIRVLRPDPPDPGNCRVVWCGAKLSRNSSLYMCRKCQHRWHGHHSTHPNASVEEFYVKPPLKTGRTPGSSKLPPERRSELARHAAIALWSQRREQAA